MNTYYVPNTKYRGKDFSIKEDSLVGKMNM